MSLIGQSLDHFVTVTNVIRHRVIETRFVRVHLERHAVRLPATEDLVAVRVGDVLLRCANHKVRESLPLA